MLSKAQRLSKPEFDRYFKSGKRYHSPALQIIHTPSEDFRAAVVVGKKVYKQAVKRNLLRRRLYATLRDYKKDHGLEGVFIIIGKPPLKEIDRKEISNLLKSELDKVEDLT